MIKRRSVITVIMILVLVFILEVLLSNEWNTEETLSRFGSYGNEVRQIQTRLRNWGYYRGDIDGIYGSKTVAAVKSFQRANGLAVDGVAGTATLNAIGVSTGNSSTGSNSANVDLLARLIYGEARGESYTGMVAVAAVVLNRVESANFPSTIAGVIYQGGAFDAVSDGQINLTPSTQAYNAARDAMNGWDPSGRSNILF